MGYLEVIEMACLDFITIDITLALQMDMVLLYNIDLEE